MAAVYSGLVDQQNVDDNSRLLLWETETLFLSCPRSRLTVFVTFRSLFRCLPTGATIDKLGIPRLGLTGLSVFVPNRGYS